VAGPGASGRPGRYDRTEGYDDSGRFAGTDVHQVYAPRGGYDAYDDDPDDQAPGYGGLPPLEYADEYDYDDDHDEYEQLPVEWSNRRRLSLAIFLVAGVLLVAILFGGLYVKNRLDPDGPPGESVAVEIPRGSSNDDIGDLLVEKGIVPDSAVFRYYVKYKGKGPFLAGTYSLPKNAALWEVVPILEAGPALVPGKTFQVEPGLTLAELPKAITDDLPALDPNKINEVLASNLIRSKYQNALLGYEGFLAPDTYQVPSDVNEVFVVRQMISQFDDMADKAGLHRSHELVSLDAYQVLIVASMVEKEAKVDADRAKIAGVIYNRLAIGQDLEIDATSCYEKLKPCVLTDSDLASPSPYNTRNRSALPPTPIAMVSAESLEAALNPVYEDGDGNKIRWYVLDPDLPEGQHFFTASEDEWVKARDRCAEANLGCG
jgi:UPF0755 protein